ncbi:hypothetical protein ACI6PS_06675 [Flavobacterium sp. PLA-1-15]|uniref:hypothetical protein n=1 Tax=Flavobacterium sp. PLA-1-15 TaxID=3380533 RepID=UPI003B7B909D
MSKSVAEKLGIKEGMSAFFVNAPEDFAVVAGLPAVALKAKLVGELDYIHLFVVTQKAFHDVFPKLKAHLKPQGFLWVSWPKSGQKETDLNIKKVIELGYDYGLVESKAISIDGVWSALKFTHPKEGKVYNNSYGTLKE